MIFNSIFGLLLMIDQSWKFHLQIWTALPKPINHKSNVELAARQHKRLFFLFCIIYMSLRLTFACRLEFEEKRNRRKFSESKNHLLTRFEQYFKIKIRAYSYTSAQCTHSVVKGEYIDFYIQQIVFPLTILFLSLWIEW